MFEHLNRIPRAANVEGGVWDALRARLNPGLYRPRRDPDVEVHRVDDRRRAPYAVLKHPRAYAYMRLAAEEEFLWNLMDGSRTVKDLILAYFAQFNSLAMGRVAGLVAHLRQTSFLVDKPQNLYGRLQAHLVYRRFTHWTKLVLGLFLGRRFFIRGIDPWIDRFHTNGGWLLFTPPLQVLSILVCVAGGFLFVQQLRSGQFNVLASGGSYSRGLGAMFLFNYIALFIHELAHALTCRHHGAKVNGAGFLLFLGIPAFYVDTTDIWTKPLRARLATSWAGPYSGLILAGLLSILIALFPGMTLAPILHRLAFAWMLILLFNLIPFVELDGYYMLVDWLDLPRLRARAAGFVRRDLWRKLRRGERFSPTERLFAWFGMISIIVTAFLVYFGISFWQTRLGAVFRELWAAGIAGRVLAVLMAFVIVVPLISSLIASAYRGARSGARWLRIWWRRPRAATVRDRLGLLNRVRFLDALPGEARRDVARRLIPVRVPTGREVFRQGDRGDGFYLIRHGEAEVVQQQGEEEARLAVLGPGDHFGEIALLGRSPRTATVRAIADLDIVLLRKGDFERLLAPHLQASATIEAAIRRSEDLRALPLLTALSSHELSQLAARLHRDVFPAQRVVVRQGEVGDTFYIIQSGQAEAVAESEGRETRLSLLGPGMWFGEIALLMNVPRTATVRALTPLTTLSLDRTSFEELLQTVLPEISRRAAERAQTLSGSGAANLE